MPPPDSSPQITPTITLITDFGTRDGYVGAMKGVIRGLAPRAQIIDITHEIEPQNIRHAAYVLASISPYYPDGTIHVVVVDPGVGSDRRPLAVFTPRACYVGPDNGVFSHVYAHHAELEIRHLTEPAYHLAQPSYTFHGRDVFAPVAAHLAKGVAAHRLGPIVSDPVRLQLARPQRREDGALIGEIVAIDHFGNCISNIPLAWLADRCDWVATIAGHTVPGLAQTYAQVAVGAPLLLGGSQGWVELAVRNGNAARQLSVRIGDKLVVR
ncbi:MAG: SAM-dependent chlorinase/fluorinase [Chloroflexi bacterium]|nr:SAM-dependent chlorinase/fluorinase [Chloroflexota bacterium]